MTKYIVSVFVLIMLCSLGHASENPYQGRIRLSKSGEVIMMRPLSQQPKVANIKNSIIEFVIITQEQSCLPLDTSLFKRDVEGAPVFAVINFEGLTQLTCGIMNKMARIKQAGGYGFILVIKDEAFEKNHCSMLDDNKFFMGIMDPENFKILEKQKTELKGQRVYGQLSIELKDSNLKLLQIWSSSLNRQSYDQTILLSKLFSKFPTMKNNLKWRPRMALLGCTHGDNVNICSENDYVASCACKGQFCSPETRKKIFYSDGKTPSVVVREDIRQMLIYKQFSSKYFEYMQGFLTSCYQNYKMTNYIEDCAQSLMTRIGIDSWTINTQINDMTQKCTDPLQKEYIQSSQLYKDMLIDKRAFANYGRYPLLLINKQIIEYKSQDDLAGQLCKKLQLEDSTCFEVLQTTFVENVVSNIFYILIITILLAMGGIVVYCYRKKLKRDMNKEIKMQVSTAVEHYYALADIN